MSEQRRQVLKQYLLMLLADGSLSGTLSPTVLATRAAAILKKDLPFVLEEVGSIAFDHGVRRVEELAGELGSAAVGTLANKLKSLWSAK